MLFRSPQFLKRLTLLWLQHLNREQRNVPMLRIQPSESGHERKRSEACCQENCSDDSPASAIQSRRAFGCWHLMPLSLVSGNRLRGFVCSGTSNYRGSLYICAPLAVHTETRGYCRSRAGHTRKPSIEDADFRRISPSLLVLPPPILSVDLDSSLFGFRLWGASIALPTPALQTG